MMNIENIINTSTPEDWIENIEDEQLRNYFIHLLKKGFSEDKIVEVWLNELKKIKDSTDAKLYFVPFDFKDYKERVLDEIVKLICGDKKYLTEQEEIKFEGKKARQYIGYTIAGSIGATFGIEVALVFPIICLLLSSIAKISVEAWCKIQLNP